MGIVVQNICKKFGDFIAVDNVSFEVKEGELAALLGPSGSGKSTILRIIAGLEMPDSGEIFLTGKNVTSFLTQKRKVGFVFQHYALFRHMTVKKNIAFGLEIQKKNKQIIEEKVNEVISLVKLWGYENHYPDQLSGGQRQRVALARALVTEPRLLLLDEPFGSLDAKVRHNLSEWLREFHCKLNITIIFVTHDQNEAIEISDKVVLINRGHVEQIGSAKQVYEHPNSKFVASFIGKVNVLDAIVENNRIKIKDTDLVVFRNKKETLSDGDIVLLVRPEDIELMKKPEGRAVLPCHINKIHYRGSHFDIECMIKNSAVLVIADKSNVLSQQWRENQEAYLFLRSYRIFEAEQGHNIIHERLKELGYIE